MPNHDRPKRPGRTQRSASAAISPTTFRRLLVPLDGSALAEAVLPVAARLADACGATIVLLHVIEKNAPTRVHGDRHLATPPEAEDYLTRIADEQGRPGRDVERHVHEVPAGNVAESIAFHAEEQRIDLIVLCTHGEGGIRDVLWGSIAQQVLQRSNRPVLLIRAESALLHPAFAPHTIIVPLDATVAAEAALPPATTLARCLDTGLRLVLVVPTLETINTERTPTATFLPSGTRALLDVQEQQGKAYLERLAAQTRALGVPTVADVRRGEPVSELAGETDAHPASLVVIATHGRAGLQAIWNPSVAAGLLTRTNAPILLVPVIE